MTQKPSCPQKARASAKPLVKPRPASLPMWKSQLRQKKRLNLRPKRARKILKPPKVKRPRKSLMKTVKTMRTMKTATKAMAKRTTMSLIQMMNTRNSLLDLCTLTLTVPTLPMNSKERSSSGKKELTGLKKCFSRSRKTALPKLGFHGSRLSSSNSPTQMCLSNLRNPATPRAYSTFTNSSKSKSPLTMLRLTTTETKRSTLKIIILTLS